MWKSIKKKKKIKTKPWFICWPHTLESQTRTCDCVCGLWNASDTIHRFEHLYMYGENKMCGMPCSLLLQTYPAFYCVFISFLIECRMICCSRCWNISKRKESRSFAEEQIISLIKIYWRSTTIKCCTKVWLLYWLCSSCALNLLVAYFSEYSACVCW